MVQSLTLDNERRVDLCRLFLVDHDDIEEFQQPQLMKNSEIDFEQMTDYHQEHL